MALRCRVRGDLVWRASVLNDEFSGEGCLAPRSADYVAPIPETIMIEVSRCEWIDLYPIWGH